MGAVRDGAEMQETAAVGAVDATAEVLASSVPEAGAGEDGEGENAAPKVIDFGVIVENTLELMQRIFMSGDQVAEIRINPDYYEGFKIAFMAQPEERVNADFKEALRITQDPNEPQLRVVTRGDLEVMLLQHYFGPREQGGNGKLPALQQVMAQMGSPVRVTIDVLRTLYLLDVLKNHVPEIITPAGHTPLSGLDLRNLRR